MGFSLFALGLRKLEYPDPEIGSDVPVLTRRAAEVIVVLRTLRQAADS